VSIPQLAAEFGVTPWTVKRQLTRAGVTLPPRRQRLSRQRRHATERRLAARAAQLGFADVQAYLADRLLVRAWPLAEVTDELDAHRMTVRRLLDQHGIHRTRRSPREQTADDPGAHRRPRTRPRPCSCRSLRARARSSQMQQRPISHVLTLQPGLSFRCLRRRRGRRLTPTRACCSKAMGVRIWRREFFEGTHLDRWSPAGGVDLDRGVEAMAGLTWMRRKRLAAEEMNDQKRRDEMLRHQYEQVCESYRAIDDFRGKLLALWPILGGAAGGVALLAARSTNRSNLWVVGLLGFFVSVDVAMYEWNQTLRCDQLKKVARRLEEDMGLELAQFRTLPPDSNRALRLRPSP
jgi:hypothetical protein